MKTGLLATLLTLCLLAGIFFASGFVLMILVNIIFGHYDIKLLDYGTSLAVNLLLWLFGGVINTSNKK